MKRCRICGVEKDLGEFRKGYAKCKACVYLFYKEWVKNNHAKVLATKRAYYARHYEECCKRSREHLKANREFINARRKERRKLSVEKYRARDRQRQPQRTIYQRERRKSDPTFNMNHVIRSRIHDALKRQYGRAGTLVDILGCSVNDFRIYIESKFEVGMSWENYGKAWEIDHIMPCAIFDMSKPEHQKRCFHFSNQQPLWKEANRAKSDKVLSNQFPLI